MRKSEFEKGIERFQQKLQKLTDRAQELDGQRVRFEELFTPGFMERHTRHASFEEMISAGGFKVETAEDFLAIPGADWDKHVADTTEFADWSEMQARAGAEWAARALKQ